MAKNIEVSEGEGERTWVRKKLTTYVSGDHFVSLKRISAKTHIPVGRLIDQALNEYFELLGMAKQPAVPPIDKDYLKHVLDTHNDH